MLLQPILRYMPHEFKWDVVGTRFYWYLFNIFLVVLSFATIAMQGFTLGIDFAGGVLLEVRYKQEQVVDIAKLRADIAALDVGEASITTVGDTGRDIVIRVPQQEGGDAAQTAALKKVQGVLADQYDIRKQDVVGPKVGAELVISGALAVALALIAIAVYLWFRFEWQFALGACLSLCSDVLTTLGLYSLFKHWLEFDLTSVAAILTIAGYSVNDSVVVYDRVREMLRKYKKMALPELLNLSVNRVMPRTLLTVFTVLLTVLALLFFGGPALRGFSIAMLWGLFVGTFSSIRVGMPVLLYLDLRRDDELATGTHTPEYERKKPAPKPAE
jgi:preprotein translocase subunit SecF